MIHHYFDLQIMVSAERELTWEEENTVGEYIRGVAIADRLVHHLHTTLSSLDLPVIEGIYLYNATLAFKTDMDGEEI